LEQFKARSAYINEKANLITALKPGGTAVLNSDDPLVWELRERLPKGVRLLTYGSGENAHVIRSSEPHISIPESAEEIQNAKTTFKLEFEGSIVPFRLRGVRGIGGMYAALAACTVGVALGVNLVAIAQALEDFVPPDGRMTLRAGKKGDIVIDDAYNASPLSVSSALDVMAEFSGHRRVIVFGDMLELGENTQRAHKEVAEKIAKVAEVVFLVGSAISVTHEELEKKGFVGGKNLFSFATADEAKNRVAEVVKKGDVVLVKASHSIELDKVVRELTGY
jgi:UDP-N-acetylmuramoyl-tripeptide--D-alanyl-D-alanine ligase